MSRVLIVVAVLVSLVGVMTVTGFAQTSGPSDAWIPGLASFIIPGLGQMLNDQIDKAIIHFGVAVGISIGGSIASNILWRSGFWYGYSIVGGVYLLWSVYSGLDAYNVAKEQGFTLGMTKDGLTLGYSF